jgi:chromosomal replication initiation ATPase DnaA|tara:strand:+ start:717 stop:941 length:225 start_codon:yes stop_codon:yes gene_type:complete
MIEDLAMEDDTRIIIKLIEDKGHDLDDETITSLTKYVETNLSSLYRITEILTGIAAYRTLIKNEEEKIESLGGV